jgi:hypothetical protein
VMNAVLLLFLNPDWFPAQVRRVETASEQAAAGEQAA